MTAVTKNNLSRLYISWEFKLGFCQWKVVTKGYSHSHETIRSVTYCCWLSTKSYINAKFIWSVRSDGEMPKDLNCSLLLRGSLIGIKCKE